MFISTSYFADLLSVGYSVPIADIRADRDGHSYASFIEDMRIIREKLHPKTTRLRVVGDEIHVEAA